VRKLTLVHSRRDPLLRDVIGAVLREERSFQRRTLADVAEASRVSLPYLSEVERGRKEPSSEVLAAICAALDLTLSDLLSRTGSYVADVTAVTSRSTPRSTNVSSGPTLSIAA